MHAHAHTLPAQLHAPCTLAARPAHVHVVCPAACACTHASFSNIDNVINSYVAEDGSGRITDLVSFYSLPSSILGHPLHSDLKAAYMYYTVPGSASLSQLMSDAMILARDRGYDVFNALDLLQNQVRQLAIMRRAAPGLHVYVGVS